MHDIYVTDSFARRSASAESGAAERALSSFFACTSGRGAPAAADRLAALPARVRALINSRRLDDALAQLARIDARAELRSAVHSARATYQRRVAAIQRELRKDHADLIRAQLAAPRLVALVNGLQYSSGGQARAPAGHGSRYWNYINPIEWGNCANWKERNVLLCTACDALDVVSVPVAVCLLCWWTRPRAPVLMIGLWF